MGGGSTPSIRQSERTGRASVAGAAASTAAISGSVNRSRNCEAKAALSGTSPISQAARCGSGFRERGRGPACGRLMARRGLYRPAATRPAMRVKA